MMNDDVLEAAPALRFGDGALVPETASHDVGQVLAEYFAVNEAAARALDDSYRRLWASIRATVEAGGKRMRPYLTILSYQAWGGQDYPAILQIGAAQEMLHACLLIHDDIIDRDLQRHGQDNIAGKYRKFYAGKASEPDIMHYANSAALIGGDLCLSAAYQLIANSGFTAPQKLVCQQQMSAAIFTEASGELLDSESALQDSAETDARKIAIQKTAIYSFVNPLISGAKLAGASDIDCKTLEQLGTSLGLAYQLTDDLLGLFGNPVKTGKSNIGDLQEGKKTVLIQAALQRVDTVGREIILAALGNTDLNVAEANQVRELVVNSGARTAIEAETDNLTDESNALITTLPIDDDYKQRLHDVVSKVSNRQY